MTKLLNHLKHNVVAYMALFVALGGTSYAAINLPAGSVGTKQLRNGAVTNKKLGKGGGGAADLDPQLDRRLRARLCRDPGREVWSGSPTEARLIAWSTGWASAIGNDPVEPADPFVMLRAGERRCRSDRPMQVRTSIAAGGNGSTGDVFAAAVQRSGPTVEVAVICPQP